MKYNILLFVDLMVVLTVEHRDLLTLLAACLIGLRIESGGGWIKLKNLSMRLINSIPINKRFYFNYQ